MTENIEQDIERDKAILAARIRIEKQELFPSTLKGLEKLCERNAKPNERLVPLHKAVRDIIRDQEDHGLDDFEFPTSDMYEMVRCIHEGCCPTCGNSAYLVASERIKVEMPTSDKDPLSRADYWGWGMGDLELHDSRVSTTVECSQGHKHTADPTLTDWVAY